MLPFLGQWSHKPVEGMHLCPHSADGQTKLHLVLCSLLKKPRIKSPGSGFEVRTRFGPQWGSVHLVVRISLFPNYYNSSSATPPPCLCWSGLYLWSRATSAMPDCLCWSYSPLGRVSFLSSAHNCSCRDQQGGRKTHPLPRLSPVSLGPCAAGKIIWLMNSLKGPW